VVPSVLVSLWGANFRRNEMFCDSVEIGDEVGVMAVDVGDGVQVGLDTRVEAVDTPCTCRTCASFSSSCFFLFFGRYKSLTSLDLVLFGFIK